MAIVIGGGTDDIFSTFHYKGKTVSHREGVCATDPQYIPRCVPRGGEEQKKGLIPHPSQPPEASYLNNNEDINKLPFSTVYSNFTILGMSKADYYTASVLLTLSQCKLYVKSMQLFYTTPQPKMSSLLLL